MSLPKRANHAPVGGTQSRWKLWIDWLEGVYINIDGRQEFGTLGLHASLCDTEAWAPAPKKRKHFRFFSGNLLGTVSVKAGMTEGNEVPGIVGRPLADRRPVPDNVLRGLSPSSPVPVQSRRLRRVEESHAGGG